MRAALGGCVVAVAYPLWAPDSSLPAAGGDHDDLRYVSIARDNIIQNVTAAGTLEAVDTVEVSSQLSGQVGKLMADHNSIVRAGEPLAALDSATFEVSVKEAEAALTVALAQHEEAKAAVDGAQAHYDDALRDLQVKSSLSKNGSVSQRDAERAQTTARSLAAELSAAQAREQVRAAGVMVARASLERARLDLERSTVKSPIDGIVIRRSVELGQTVAASLQAPTLFTIARDLSDMRVNASVSEADIGAVRTGQRALFSVDSYPGRTFEGRVLEIRKAARMVQNVVTYTVMISAPNPEDLLLPGMTADVRIVVQEQHDVMVVPNAALSFRPVREGTTDRAPGQGVIWVRTKSGHLDHATVSLGATSDSLTQIVSPDVQIGQRVAIGYRSKP
ncbi:MULTISPECIES: efflux RND transporter periplasmic adaptor subunit [unclassified Bradyrhizobium]|uniref:efflux RND transporter periplasmic adaptor subunit n=1 Tax=unclassified Bradyrhizobium TaxID=2631580 RepID=UPI002478DD42|nr:MULTISPECIES: efflux RND transporter periplasmic adaptor subunit [unclassified Bradyrhizobium]WGR69023.1 efflux RND transporter periplasmic adaptor subunit [Bradyrhizobium sp. ISRA426]WGR81078.1 efflux RND transporter periplasmic adaptor subunit [Bradyrhizobium sp. ISRA430]WGR84262.1 efflux RND transporter periplasmic adaptor subunit [Bradyrhizobium sp. ISRA432]